VIISCDQRPPTGSDPWVFFAQLANRVTYLIDGFNLYHSVSEAETATRGAKWLNIWGMCKALLPNIDPAGGIDAVYYFSAYAYFLQQAAPDKIAPHKVYVEALEASGVQVKMGRFKPKWVTCKICGKKFKTHEEKETDVTIALAAAHICSISATDTIVLVTGDTDLVPALDHIKQEYPNIRRGVVFP